MPDVQVRCITKLPTHNDPYHCITELGGDGWKWPKANVIVSIENGTNSFFTLVNGKRAIVVVVNGAHGKYLRTIADGVYNDNLLALPSCVG